MAGHLIGWIGVGLVVGWVYGWRRLTPSYNRAREILSDPAIDQKSRRRAMAEQQGNRMVGAIFGAAFGTFGGLIVGVLTWLFAMAMGWR